MNAWKWLAVLACGSMGLSALADLLIAEPSGLLTDLGFQSPWAEAVLRVGTILVYWTAAYRTAKDWH